MIWGRRFWNEIPIFSTVILDFKSLLQQGGHSSSGVQSVLSYTLVYYKYTPFHRKLTKCGWEEKDLHIPACLPHSNSTPLLKCHSIENPRTSPIPAPVAAIPEAYACLPHVALHHVAYIKLLQACELTHA